MCRLRMTLNGTMWEIYTGVDTDPAICFAKEK